MNFEKLFKAMDYMVVVHKDQVRKTSGVPKATHLFGVASILMNFGYDTDVVIAGLLHDVVEDTSHTINEIETLFGNTVATYVSSETEIDKSFSWKMRKDETISRLKNAPVNVKAIAAADKINNMMSLTSDLETIGESIWSAFKASKDDVIWYYKEVSASICTGVDGGIFDLLNKTLENLLKRVNN